MSDDGGPSDRRLLADHVDGDPDAFTALVRRHRDRLWAVSLRTLGDQEEAADALQDALISAYRNAAGYRGDSEVTTWLHRIVVNACLDRLRRRRTRPSVTIEGREVAARRDDHAATVARLDVRAALARLPEQQRVALVLVDLEDLPVSEVAELLGVAEGTVKSRCSRARVALAAMLRDGEKRAESSPSLIDGSDASNENRGNPRRRGRVQAGDGEGGERVRNG